MGRVHFANCSPTRTNPESDDMRVLENHYTPSGYDMLRISPSDFIYFSRADNNNESSIELTCSSNFPITYKIQTTSPEKFRVRPRCGLLSPGESISVCIVLKADYHLSEGSKDKFLIMAIPAPHNSDPSPQNMAEMWKQKSNSPDIEQHRLCCAYKTAGEPVAVRNGYNNAVNEVSETKSVNTVADLSRHAKQLESQLKFTQLLQCVTLVFLLALSVAVVYLLKLETSASAGLGSCDAAMIDDSCKTGDCGGCSKGRHL